MANKTAAIRRSSLMFSANIVCILNLYVRPRIGPAYQTCRDAAWVASRFELSRRKDNLTFNQHAQNCAPSPHEADALLDRREETIEATGSLI
jgi:hypothetical protein